SHHPTPTILSHSALPFGLCQLHQIAHATSSFLFQSPLQSFYTLLPLSHSHPKSQKRYRENNSHSQTTHPNSPNEIESIPFDFESQENIHPIQQLPHECHYLHVSHSLLTKFSTP